MQHSSLPPNAVSEEQAKKLRGDLAKAQQEVENLQASASIHESLASVPADDGTKSIAEQVKERVEQIRADLESRHNQRVKQAEETYQKRTELMKTQFNKKVPEIKDQLRQNLVAEHEKVLQKVRSDHEQEMEELRVKHQADLDELKRNEDSRSTDLKQEWLAEQSTQNTTGESSVKDETQASQKPLEPTEAEARELIVSNPTIRGILARNITEKVAKAKEIQAVQLKEEHEKALADNLSEAQSKANTAKEQAVMTEEKRNSVKLSMADNRAKVASFRLTLVQKAADETPQKPVIEVWTVVKDAKPPQTAIQQPQQKTPQTSTFGQPTPAMQGAQRSAPNAPGQAPPMPVSTGAFMQSAPIAPMAAGQSQQMSATTGILGQTTTAAPTGIFGQSAPIAPTGVFGQPIPMTQNAQTNPSGGQGKPQQALGQGQMLPPQSGKQQPTTTSTNSPTQSRTPPASQIPSNPSASQSSQGPPNGNQRANAQSASDIPMKPQLAQSNQHHNAGSGPAAVRSLQNSGLPIARGGRGGGGPHPRGRGQGGGRGRGGHDQINTNQQQGQQGRASPTSQLNGGARQFVPGNKRPREEGGEGGQGHDGEGEGERGKRVRGGMGGP